MQFLSDGSRRELAFVACSAHRDDDIAFHFVDRTVDRFGELRPPSGGGAKVGAVADDERENDESDEDAGDNVDREVNAEIHAGEGNQKDQNGGYDIRPPSVQFASEVPPEPN